jgi:hypothetical protein
MMNDKPIALDAYETLAEAYASVAVTDEFWTRPVALACIPNGCFRAAQKLSPLMQVPKMVEAFDVRQADLSQPLTFLDGESFDVLARLRPGGICG